MSLKQITAATAAQAGIMSWPPIDSEWSQADLHRWIRQFKNPDPSEVLPQGVKYVAWPQPRPTEADRQWGLVVESRSGSGSGGATRAGRGKAR